MKGLNTYSVWMVIALMLVATGCAGVKQAPDRGVSLVEVTADMLLSKERRQRLDGKLVRMSGRSTIDSWEDAQSGIELLRPDGRAMFIGIGSVRDQRMGKQFERSSGAWLTVEGLYYKVEASPAAGSHPFGLLLEANIVRKVQ